MRKLSKTLDDIVFELLSCFSDVCDIHDNKRRLTIKKIVSENFFYALNNSTQNVTVLFSDIRGFTQITEFYQMTEILTLLNNYYRHMNLVVQKYNGVIDKYMGDGMMIVFGIEENEVDAPLRAVACAVEMQITMDKVNQVNKSMDLPEIFMGIGVNTGLVSIGDLGSDIHREFTVIGDEVNLAARIESHSLRGQILISENTYNAVQNHIEVSKSNKVRVKGKEQPVILYEVSSIDYPEVMKVPEREIRDSKRVAMDMSCQFAIVEGSKTLSEFTCKGVIKDLSYSGMSIITKEDIPIYTDIKLDLILSPIGGENYAMYAKIVSKLELKDGNCCGVMFTGIDGNCQKAINDYVDRLVSGA